LHSRSRTDLVVLLVVFGLLAARFWFVCDDAFITFRFARNLATGRGLVFNPGEWPPVEGYSDFLWLVGAYVLELLGQRPDRWMPAVSVLCGAWLVARVYVVARERLDLGRDAAGWGTLVAAASPAIGCWATSGLETMPQALLTFLLFERVVLDRASWWVRCPAAAGPARRGWPEELAPVLIAVALALIRTEGIAWVAVVFAVSIAAQWVDRAPMHAHLRFLARIAAPVICVFAIYTAWRFHYYGTLVPNTALVKVGFGHQLVARGAKYVALFFATCVTPLVGFAAVPFVVRNERHGTWLAISALALGFPAYAVVVGGDFMPFGRLLVPGVPFAALLVAGGLQELVRRRRGDPARARAVGAVLLVASLLPAFDLHVVPHAIRQTLHFRLSDRAFLTELNRWENQRENTAGFTRRGRALAQVADPADAVVAAAVGAVGYWSGITIYDQHGLVTKEVAYRPLPDGPLTQSPGHDKHVDPLFFLKYEPRFLYARAVEGKLAAGRMKDTLDQWQVPADVTDRYVPDFFEVAPIDEGVRSFLFVVRRAQPGEDPAKIWGGFPGRRRKLNAELRDEADDSGSETSG
jgi:arabinofuranosyltransferase